MALQERRSVASLKPGQEGVIKGFSDDVLSLKLLEMGCLPGTSVKFNYTAPFGDPICISVQGYELSLRVNEASSIEIE
ncbi:MAG: ferrous iron transport protein A [Cyclobacteriaceae bacterium]|nr:ferrous iron transport protein A [Cyclobacteriaceae bacterium]